MPYAGATGSFVTAKGGRGGLYDDVPSHVRLIDRAAAPPNRILTATQHMAQLQAMASQLGEKELAAIAEQFPAISSQFFTELKQTSGSSPRNFGGGAVRLPGVRGAEPSPRAARQLLAPDLVTAKPPGDGHRARPTKPRGSKPKASRPLAGGRTLIDSRADPVGWAEPFLGSHAYDEPDNLRMYQESVRQAGGAGGPGAHPMPDPVPAPVLSSGMPSAIYDVDDPAADAHDGLWEENPAVRASHRAPLPPCRAPALLAAVACASQARCAFGLRASHTLPPFTPPHLARPRAAPHAHTPRTCAHGRARRVRSQILAPAVVLRTQPVDLLIQRREQALAGLRGLLHSLSRVRHSSHRLPAYVARAYQYRLQHAVGWCTQTTAHAPDAPRATHATRLERPATNRTPRARCLSGWHVYVYACAPVSVRVSVWICADRVTTTELVERLTFERRAQHPKLVHTPSGEMRHIYDPVMVTPHPTAITEAHQHTRPVWRTSTRAQFGGTSAPAHVPSVVSAVRHPPTVRRATAPTLCSSSAASTSPSRRSPPRATRSSSSGSRA
jgi:hypothetical protein